MTPNVLVGIPLERNISAICFGHFLAIAKRGYNIAAGSYGPTHAARNILAQELLKSDCTHLLMLDSDMLHPVDIVERLTRWLDRPEQEQPEIIGALYFRRGMPYDPCAYMFAEDGSLLSLATWPQGLIKVDAIGTGAILIARSVFEKIAFPWFEYTYWNGRALSSEDIVFCRKCHAAHIPIWCDTTTVVPHMTEAPITKQVYHDFIATAQTVDKQVETDLIER